MMLAVAVAGSGLGVDAPAPAGEELRASERGGSAAPVRGGVATAANAMRAAIVA
jgi:hypothetical protein